MSDRTMQRDPSMLRSANFIVLLGLFLAAMGCQNSAAPNRPKTVKARATVTYKGEPVQGADVSLSPASKDGHAAVGTTDAAGHVVLMTYESGDGALPGSYQVTVRKTESVVGAVKMPGQGGKNADYAKVMAEAIQKKGKAEAPENLLPAKYKDAKTSGLTADVKEGSPNDFTFTLTD